MKLQVIFIVFAACFSFQACVKKPILKSNTVYYLKALYSGGQKNNLCLDKGHIIFNEETKSAACFTSCNFIRLKYSSNKESFKFTSVVPDTEPCPDPLIGLEEDLKMNLPLVNRCIKKGEDLFFMKDKDTLLIYYEKKKVNE